MHGALDLIAEAGGGVGEGYPHDIPEGKKMMSTSFLHNLTRITYEDAPASPVSGQRARATA